MKRIISDTFSEPRHIAITSAWLIGVFYLLWLFAPESTTIEQAETWTTIGVLGTLAYLISSSVIVHRTVVHTYVFFLGCMALFIAGRYVAHAMGYDPMAAEKWKSRMFGINMSYFIIMDLGPKEAIRLSLYIVTCLLAIHTGYMYALWKKPTEVSQSNNLEWTYILKYPAIALAVISAMVFAMSFPEAYRIVHSEGYIALYRGAADFTTRGSTAAQYGLLIALGLAFASRTKWLTWCVLGLLAIYYIASLKIGVRGGIMGFALLCVWLFHTQIRRIDKIALIGLPIVLAGLLMLATLGARNFYFDEHATDLLPWFIDAQGYTALYVYLATTIDAYPTLAYIHSIFPATPTIAAMFGSSIPLDQLYFGQHLSKTVLLGDAYQSGQGMGWSVLADFYAYTLWVPGLYIVVAAGFGAALSRLVTSTNPLIFGAHVMLFVKIMLLPRAGIYSIIPFLIAYAGIVVACYIFSRFISRKTAFSHN